MYINTQTLQRTSESDIRAAFPNTSFPVPFVAPEGYALVFPSPPPEFNPITQRAQEIDPVLTAKGHYEQQWEVVSRFQEYIDSENVTHTVAEQEAEAVAEHLAKLRADRWEAIKAERERRAQQGGYQVAGKWLHSDTFSRSQQLGLVYLGSNIPEGLMWKTMDGTYVEMTQAMALSVFQAALVADRANFQHAEFLKAQVDASSDPNAVDILAGWPEVFRG